MKKPIKYTNEPIEAKVVEDFLPPPDKLRLRQSSLKVTYDMRTDILRIRLKEGAVSESDEVAAGVILDFDAEGAILEIELLDASARSSNPKALEFGVS
ncbi:MAG: DUF2283 domain-containing protein [Pirellulales bacterium]|nr:DUF2283 domain-containing protein [Pirellulales bacterium]